MKAYNAWISGLVGLLVLVWGWQAEAQLIELKEQATVSGADVLLRDVIRDPGTLPAEWRDRRVASAPNPRQTRQITLVDVAQSLNGYGDMNSVVLRGRSSIEITARHRSVELEDVQQAVDDYVFDEAEWDGRRFEVCEDQFRLPHIPDGDLAVYVVALREGREPGRAIAEVSLHVNGEPHAGTSRVHLMELRPYWAASRPLQRGEVITFDSVTERWLPALEAGRYFPGTHPVEGMELRRNVQAGQLFTSGMLAEPVFARRGEVIQVVSQRGPLTVTMRARALADGRRDESILCVNEQSGRRMHVRLVGPREAMLDDEGGESRI